MTPIFDVKDIFTKNTRQSRFEHLLSTMPTLYVHLQLPSHVQNVCANA